MRDSEIRNLIFWNLGDDGVSSNIILPYTITKFNTPFKHFINLLIIKINTQVFTQFIFTHQVSRSIEIINFSIAVLRLQINFMNKSRIFRKIVGVGGRDNGYTSTLMQFPHKEIHMTLVRIRRLRRLDFKVKIV